jgi:UDP-N-acetylmuramate dehydrogenase
LQKENKDVIASSIERYLFKRRDRQMDKLPNAGCIFKNPPDQVSAGKLIDLCGLKGKRKGGAVISKMHANFILNLDKAKSRDVLFLMNLMRRKVRLKFGIYLEPEIKLWK